jgi:hypothetical protein
MKQTTLCFFVASLLFCNTLFAQSKCDCAIFTKELKGKFGAANLGGKLDEARAVVAEVLKSTDPC